MTTATKVKIKRNTAAKSTQINANFVKNKAKIHKMAHIIKSQSINTVSESDVKINENSTSPTYLPSQHLLNLSHVKPVITEEILEISQYPDLIMTNHNKTETTASKTVSSSISKRWAKIWNAREIPRSLSIKPDGYFIPKHIESFADFFRSSKNKTVNKLDQSFFIKETTESSKTSIKTFILISVLTMAPLIVIAGIWQTNKIKTIVQIETQSIQNNIANLKTKLATGQIELTNNDLQNIKTSLNHIDRAIVLVKPFIGLTGMLKLGSISQVAPTLSAANNLTDATIIASTALKQFQIEVDPNQKIDGLILAGVKINQLITSANQSLEKIDENKLDPKYKNEVINLKDQTKKIGGIAAAFTLASPKLKNALGFNEPRQYLTLFQNNTELRATGGFIGSFALITLKNGQIEKYDIPAGGSYDLKGDLKVRLAAPRPLRLVNPLWQFQDANWFPDFKTSADQAATLFEKSGGPTVDGVIAINANVFEDLIKILGPISMAGYNKTIDSKSFLLETQKAVELEYDKKQNKPKQFIADLAPIALEMIKTIPESKQPDLLNLLTKHSQERNLQIWSKDLDVENFLASVNLDGSLAQTNGDYLNIVHSNIAGQKTDAVMNDNLKRTTKILPDGSVIVSLELARTHSGIKNELFRGVRNMDYVRFYVPQGSTFIEADGFKEPNKKLFKLTGPGMTKADKILISDEQEITDPKSKTSIYNESNKTVFGNWIQTDPGMTTTVTIKYSLPKSVVNFENGNQLIYSSFFQKQSGVNPITVTDSLDLPKNARLIKSDYKKQAGNLDKTFILNRDIKLNSVIEFK